MDCTLQSTLNGIKKATKQNKKEKRKKLIGLKEKKTYRKEKTNEEKQKKSKLIG